MKVILSIKPKFVDLIVANIKHYEFRKTIFKCNDVDTIIVYSSSPVKRLVGEFKIETILKDTPQNIWKTTKQVSGLSEIEFFNYYKNKNIAYAIKIKDFILYDNPLILEEEYPGYKPPQSFRYAK